MRDLILAALIIHFCGNMCLVFEIYLKFNSMEYYESLLNYAIAIIGMLCVFKRKGIYVHFIQIVHFGYLINLALENIEKKLKQEIDEVKVGGLFMTFIVFFTSTFNDFNKAVKSGKIILYELRFFILNIFGIVLCFVSLILYCFDYYTYKDKDKDKNVNNSYKDKIYTKEKHKEETRNKIAKAKTD